jgi:hypothetical protein
MAGPRRQLRWAVVRFEKEGREGREDELHGKEKERFLASFVWVLHVILSALLSFSSSPHFFSARNPLTRIISLAAIFTPTRFFYYS